MRDTNFYYSFLVLPPEKRRAIVAVWDFCRAVDDDVDDVDNVDDVDEVDDVDDVDDVDEAAAQAASGRAAAALARWRAELAACFDGATPATAQGRALQPWVRRFPLPRDAFEALIDGVEMDLGHRRYATFDDLYQYCIRVASTVGLICIEIFGYTDSRVKQYATDLGVALQLTNILRDVPSDLARGRVYLPVEDLKRHGCTEQDLRDEAAHAGSGVRSDAVKRLLAFEAGRAREYYARASAALPRADARRLAAAEIMGAIYSAILGRIEAAGYDVFSRVIRIPRPRRAAIAATTWLRLLLHV